MEDICHHINIDIDGIDEKDVHAHLIVNPSLHLIPFKVYFNKSLEGKKTQLVDWIKSQKDYSEFGKMLSVTKINNPNYVIDIDYSKSKIGLIADTNIGEDRDGKFIGFGFKQVTIDYRQNSKIDPERIQSVIFLDNHAYNLINSISEVDSFQTDPKQWKSTSKQTNLIEFGECWIFRSILTPLIRIEKKFRGRKNQKTSLTIRRMLTLLVNKGEKKDKMDWIWCVLAL